MNIRSATISDVEPIYSLINDYAEQDKMLFRSMADIYKNLQTFTVAEDDGARRGCLGPSSNGAYDLFITENGCAADPDRIGRQRGDQQNRPDYQQSDTYCFPVIHFISPLLQRKDDFRTYLAKSL